jgi:YggT family protein
LRGGRRGGGLEGEGDERDHRASLSAPRAGASGRCGGAAIAAPARHRYIDAKRSFPENLMLIALFGVVDLLLQVMMWIIIIQAILSWLVAFNVINTHSDFVRSFLNALDWITAPLYRPIRRILPDFGGLDFSPMVVLLLIYVLRILLAGAAADIAMSTY